jgi:hypothetical protein
MRWIGGPDAHWFGACLDALGIGGAAQAGASVAGTALQVGEEDKAINAEQTAASNSAKNLAAAGQTAQGYYNPYVAGGTSVYNDLISNNALYSNINNGFTDQAEGASQQALGATNQANSIYSNLANGGITAQTIQNLPGYQAINALGQQGVTNSAAARGLASSGAALKGAADYATTQAQGGYQNLVQDQLSTASGLNSTAAGYGTDAANYLNTNTANQGNITNAFNRENALATTGYSASNASAGNALAAAGASNAYSNQAAQAVGAGSVGIGNATSTGLTSLGNTASQYQIYNQLLNGGGGNAFTNAGGDIDSDF